MVHYGLSENAIFWGFRKRAIFLDFNGQYQAGSDSKQK